MNSNSQDLVTAMSVFTHLQEKAAIEYRNKIHDVLVQDGLAIISFLIVRDYVNPNNDIYNYTRKLTPGWFTSTPSCPECSIGIEYSALLNLLGGKFKILGHIEGCLTGGKHPSMQDLLVLRKI